MALFCRWFGRSRIGAQDRDQSADAHACGCNCRYKLRPKIYPSARQNHDDAAIGRRLLALDPEKPCCSTQGTPEHTNGNNLPGIGKIDVGHNVPLALHLPRLARKGYSLVNPPRAEEPGYGVLASDPRTGQARPIASLADSSARQTEW